jgi:copper(I)-binding protein
VSSVRRRRLAASSLSAVVILTLSACGFDDQTNQQYQPAAGANYRSSTINVLNTVLVANANKSATLSASIVNNSNADQTLSSVTVDTLDGNKSLPVRGLKSLLPLPKGGSAVLGQASDAGGWTVTDGAKPGFYVKVTLNFTDAPPVTVEAPVVARTPDYDYVTTG